MSNTVRAALALCALTAGCGSNLQFPATTSFTIVTRTTVFGANPSPVTPPPPVMQAPPPVRVVYQPTPQPATQPVYVPEVQTPVRYAVGPSLTTAFHPQRTYQSGEAIRVRFAGMSGSTTDWVTLVPEGSEHTRYDEWTYTNGDRDGEYTFRAPAPGRYVARAYFNWPDGDYQLRAESQPIVVY